MKLPETGALLDEFPYVRVGDGPRTLLVVPGVEDAIFEGTYPPVAGWAMQAYFARYLDEHTVYVVSRPRGLPEGYTARDAAADYARLLDAELGRVDVMGISAGGMMGIELSADRPDLVERFVLVDSGYRIAEECLDDVRRLREYAVECDWAAIRAELARAMFSDVRQVVYPPLIRTVGRFVLPLPAVASDVRIAFDLVLAYDGRDRLREIDQPTLVFAGSRDPYFTEAIVTETADVVPNATLSLVEGAKHAAYHERKWTFDDRATEFLARDA